MNLSENLPKYLVIGFLIAGGGAMLFSKFAGNGSQSTAATINVPKLTAQAEQGKRFFDQNCAACHGKNAGGSEKGPPLVHKIYEPSHHADGAFFIAAKNGARAHHWRFGNMPPVPAVTQQQVILITHYVRELQRANGIN